MVDFRREPKVGIAQKFRPHKLPEKGSPLILRLVRRLNRLKMSYTELSAITGLDRSTMSKKIHGQVAMTLTEAEVCFKAVGAELVDVAAQSREAAIKIRMQETRKKLRPWIGGSVPPAYHDKDYEADALVLQDLMADLVSKRGIPAESVMRAKSRPAAAARRFLIRQLGSDPYKWSRRRIARRLHLTESFVRKHYPKAAETPMRTLKKLPADPHLPS